MLRRVLGITVLVAVFGAPAFAQQPAAPDETPTAPRESNQPDSNLPAKPAVAGVYHCEGKNPDGSPYEGLVEIAKIDDTYLVHWLMADGAEVLGVGIEKSGVLAVSYFGGTPAVAVYRIEGDQLLGEWTMGGAEGMLYSETLTRMAEHPGRVAPPPQPQRPVTPRRTRPVAGVREI